MENFKEKNKTAHSLCLGNSQIRERKPCVFSLPVLFLSMLFREISPSEKIGFAAF